MHFIDLVVRRRKGLLVAGLLALSGTVVLLWCHRGRQELPARVEVISQVPTNGGHVVRLRLLPTDKGPFMASTDLKLGYGTNASFQRSFRCESSLGGMYYGPKDFNVFFPTNYPVWRLQLSMSVRAGIFQRLKWDVAFTIERLRGFGWLPTPSQFFGLLDAYKSFLPTEPKILVSDAIVIGDVGR